MGFSGGVGFLCFGQAALFVFLSAATGAGIISSGFVGHGEIAGQENNGLAPELGRLYSAAPMLARSLSAVTHSVFLMSSTMGDPPL